MRCWIVTALSSAAVVCGGADKELLSQLELKSRVRRVTVVSAPVHRSHFCKFKHSRESDVSVIVLRANRGRHRTTAQNESSHFASRDDHGEWRRVNTSIFSCRS